MLKLTITIIFLGVLSFSEAQEKVRFCEYRCGSIANIICRLKPCPMGINCQNRGKMLAMNEKDRNKILHKVNTFRSEKSRNFLSKAGKKTIANLSMMAYERELEFQAQCWANSCIMSYAECVRSSRNDEVNQIMFVEHLDHDDVISEAIKNWTNVDTANISMKVYSSFRYSQETVAILNLLAYKAKFLGCGRSVMMHFYFFFCFIAPTPAVFETVFEFGEPCKTDCSSKYPGLTEYTSNFKNFDPPFHISSANDMRIYSIICSFSLVLLRYLFRKIVF